MTDLLKYQDCLKEAGRRKAHADSISLSKWERIVLCHQAADLEVLAIEFLGGFPTETVINHLAEAIALYIESHDPGYARVYLSKLQQIAGQLPDDDYVQGMLARISPRVKSAYSSYEKHIDKLPVNQPYKESPLENWSLKEIDKLLRKFPGMWNLWWIRHCYCFRNNEMPDAGIAIKKATLLSPSNEQLSASLMLFVSHVEPRALSTLELCRSELKRFINSALINTTFAISVLHAQRGQIRKSVLREAVEAILRSRELGATDFEDTITVVASLFSWGPETERMTSSERVNALLKLVGLTDGNYLGVELANDSTDIIPIVPDQLHSWVFNKIQPDISHSLRAI